MFPPPTGVEPSPEQVRELDDEFFSSDPFGYFQARIESLVAYADGAVAQYQDGLGGTYASRLRRAPEEMLRATDDARELQVVTDALSLRQHAAEALVRLWAAVLETRHTAPGEVSVWATLADGRIRTAEVLDQIGSTEGASDPDVQLRLLVPGPLIGRVKADPELQRAIGVLFTWLEHAEHVLVRGDIHLAAANNKVKHGLAVRPTNTLRVDFLPQDAVPDPESISVSTLASGVPLFDRPVVEYLARPTRKEGLELTQLRLDAATLLTEATMLATVHAAVFHVAAARYAASSRTIESIVPYPKLPLGPTPVELLGKAVTGMRSPVTLPKGGGPPLRGPGIGFNDRTFWNLTVDYDGHRSGRLTDG